MKTGRLHDLKGRTTTQVVCQVFSQVHKLSEREGHAGE